MTQWPSTKARKVLQALLNKGWVIDRQKGSMRILKKVGFERYRFDFHDAEELGHVMLKLIAKHTDLEPEDL